MEASQLNSQIEPLNVFTETFGTGSVKLTTIWREGATVAHRLPSAERTPSLLKAEEAFAPSSLVSGARYGARRGNKFFFYIKLGYSWPITKIFYTLS